MPSHEPAPERSEADRDPIPEPPAPPRISVVIVSLNRAEALRKSLTLLAGVHQTVVVDQGSTDGSAAAVDAFPGVRTMRLPKNFGLTRALNIGLRACEGEYLLCLHDDARLSADAVTQLADYLETHPDVGMVCPLLVNEEGGRMPQVSPLPSPDNPNLPLTQASGDGEIVTACVSGGAFMFRAFFLRALRQIEERYGTYGSNVELCAQMKRAAKKVVVLTAVQAIHEASRSPVPVSALEADRANGTAAFLGKHHGFMSGLGYRLRTGLAALFTFRFSVAAGALSGQKIDGA